MRCLALGLTLLGDDPELGLARQVRQLRQVGFSVVVDSDTPLSSAGPRVNSITPRS